MKEERKREKISKRTKKKRFREMEGEGEREKYHDGFVKFGGLPLHQ